MNMRVLAPVGLIGAVACGQANPGGSANESAVRQFYVDVNAFYMGYGHPGIEGHDPEAHVPPCS